MTSTEPSAATGASAGSAELDADDPRLDVESLDLAGGGPAPTKVNIFATGEVPVVDAPDADDGAATGNGSNGNGTSGSNGSTRAPQPAGAAAALEALLADTPAARSTEVADLDEQPVIDGMQLDVDADTGDDDSDGSDNGDESWSAAASTIVVAPAADPVEADDDPDLDDDELDEALAEQEADDAADLAMSEVGDSLIDDLAGDEYVVVSSGRRSGPRGKLKARKVRRIVRYVSPWSVFKVSLLFTFCLWVILTIAGVILWQVAEKSGQITNVEKFLAKLLAESSYTINGRDLFRAFASAGVVLVFAGTGFMVLMSLLFNVICDITGGIRFTVLELESTRREIRTRNPERVVARAASGEFLKPVNRRGKTKRDRRPPRRR